MSEAELQDWLYGTAIQGELRSIARATASLEIDNLTPVQTADEPEYDWGRLLLASSILARSKVRVHREAALRFATAALLLETTQDVRDAAVVVLEKLSNHRAVVLAEERRRIRPDPASRLGVALRLEDESRSLYNSVLLGPTGERVAVNDFQREFWAGAMQRDAWLSASAPTASGKTFLVLKWLLDTLASDGNQRAVYLAPTRALVSEIESALTELIQAGQLPVEVTSLPSLEKYRSA